VPSLFSAKTRLIFPFFETFPLMPNALSSKSGPTHIQRFLLAPNVGFLNVPLASHTYPRATFGKVDEVSDPELKLRVSVNSEVSLALTSHV
jgi:hypothetical protein